MERVWTIVDGKVVLLAVQLELALADTVSVSSNECREIWLRRVYYFLDVVMSLNNVGHLAVFVRNHDGYDCSTIVGDSNFVAFVVSKDV